MLITTKELVSSGSLENFTPKNTFQLKPLTFEQVLNLNDDKDISENPASLLLRDSSLLNLNLDFLPFIDLEYLVFLHKVISINKDVLFETLVECKKCGKNHNYKYSNNEVSLITLDERPLPKRVSFSSTEHKNDVILNIKIPSSTQFLNNLSHELSEKGLEDKKILQRIRLMSLFSEYETNKNNVKKIIEKSTGNDIYTLLILENEIFDRVKVKPYVCTCGCENYISFDVSKMSLFFF